MEIPLIVDRNQANASLQIFSHPPLQSSYQAGWNNLKLEYYELPPHFAPEHLPSQTAYNFISVYEAFPEFNDANFARLDISISALYLLAAPSTPPQTRSQFLDRALAGEQISHKIIQMSLKQDRFTNRLTVSPPSPSAW